MQWRRWIGFWAVLGVLLHAGLLVRHNAMAFAVATGATDVVHSGTVATYADGAADLAIHTFCGIGDSATVPGDAEGPAKPDKSHETCPICGSAPAGAVLADAHLDVLPIVPSAVRLTGRSESRPIGSGLHYWPSSRGPPPAIA